MTGRAYEEAMIDDHAIVHTMRRIIHLPHDFPQIITLCGSTRFREMYEKENRRLTEEGHIVISVGLFGHEIGLDMDGDLKKRLDELHLRKIDLCDRVHVINPVTPCCNKCGKVVELTTAAMSRCYPCGEFFPPEFADLKPYVGESTRREIAYAQQHGKLITYLDGSQS